MNDREIEQFFDALTPEKFVHDTSFFSRPMPDSTNFQAFINEHIDVTRIAFASCDGEIYPIASLATKERVHYFKAEDDENLGQFTDRISAFAKTHNGRWVFIFKKVSAMVDDEEVEALYWMAGERDLNTGEVAYRQGYFEILGQTLGECLEAPPDENREQPVKFREILEGSR